MTDLAAVRRRRRRDQNGCSAPFDDVALRGLYEPVAPSAPERLAPELGVALKRWWAARYEFQELTTYLDEQRAGIAITLRHAAHEPGTGQLLGPEILLALYGLWRDPAALREMWPADRDAGELDLLADAYGRPYSS